jgi:methyl-accepting chemotaxis protein
MALPTQQDYFVKRFKTVGFRMTVAATFLILLSVVSGYIFLQNAGNYRDDAETVTGLAKRTINVFETDVLIYKLVRAEKDYVLTAGKQFKDERINFSNQVDTNFDTLIEGSLTQESKDLLNDLKNRKADYDKNFATATGIYDSYTNRGGFGSVLDENEAVAFGQVKNLSLTNTDILLAAETNLISKIIGIDVDRIESTLVQARKNSDFARVVAFIVIFVALTAGVIVSVYIVRSTTFSLRAIVERLVTLAGVLRDSVSQATDVAAQNATTASQLASSATQQSKQVEEITTTISQTAAGITGVAGLAKEGSDSATKVNDLSQKGGEGAEKASASLESISKVVSGAVEQIKSLATRSREVGTLAGEVTSIADQTNILALNAAIEAARAGEAGRGFAVVADEVRRLAESSRSFADQITKLINSVVEEAQQTAQNTSEGAKEITESTGIINTSLASFKLISDAVAEASAKIQQISTNISQQAQAAEQISGTSKSIAKGVEQNSSGAKTLADAVDQQKVVISVIEKSLEEAQSILEESSILVGLSTEELSQSAGQVDSNIPEGPALPTPVTPKKDNIDKTAPIGNEGFAASPASVEFENDEPIIKQ